MGSSPSAEETPRKAPPPYLLLDFRSSDFEKTLIHVHWYTSILNVSANKPLKPFARVARFVRESLGDALYLHWGIILHYRNAKGEDTIYNIYGDREREGEPKGFKVRIETGIPDGLVEHHYCGSTLEPPARIIDAGKQVTRDVQFEGDYHLIDTNCQEWVVAFMEHVRWNIPLVWFSRVNLQSVIDGQRNNKDDQFGAIIKVLLKKFDANLLIDNRIVHGLRRYQVESLPDEIVENFPYSIILARITVNLHWAKFSGKNDGNGIDDGFCWGVLMSFQEQTNPVRTYHCTMTTLYEQDDEQKLRGFSIGYSNDRPNNILQIENYGTVKWIPILLITRFVMLLLEEWHDKGRVDDEKKLAERFFDSLCPVKLPPAKKSPVAKPFVNELRLLVYSVYLLLVLLGKEPLEMLFVYYYTGSIFLLHFFISQLFPLLVPFISFLTRLDVDVSVSMTYVADLKWTFVIIFGLTCLSVFWFYVDLTIMMPRFILVISWIFSSAFEVQARKLYCINPTSCIGCLVALDLVAWIMYMDLRNEMF